MSVQLSQTPNFVRTVKRLHANQKQDVDEAVSAIIANPYLGQSKAGDLSWLRVYKFRMVSQLTLLAYETDGENKLILHALGSHENFYRDLKAH